MSGLVLLLVAALCLSCSSPDPPPIEERGTPHAPPPTDGPRDEGEGAGEQGPPDHWIVTYGAYFSNEARRDYLATKPEHRFEKYSLFLLDLRLREDLLEENRAILSRDDIQRFRSLKTAEEARAFISLRRLEAARRATREREADEQSRALDREGDKVLESAGNAAKPAK